MESRFMSKIQSKTHPKHKAKHHKNAKFIVLIKYNTYVFQRVIKDNVYGVLCKSSRPNAT